MLTSFSGVAGGGVLGMAVGIVHGIMTGAGVIITMFRGSIMMWTQGGEDITGTVFGTGASGIMNRFLTNDFNGTGRPGIIIDTGKGKEPGVFRVINPDHSHRDGKSDSRENGNINRGQRFSNIDN